MADKRRERHGRGLRGRLVAPAVRVAGREVRVPLALSRADRFDQLVRDAIETVEGRCPTPLDEVEFAVEDVPPPDSGAAEGVVADETAGGPVPLGRLTVATATSPPRVVVYRRPLEARALGTGDLGELVHDVVADQVGQLLGLDPEEL